MFGPFHPFWIRKPVPVIPPSIQFSQSIHHPTVHPPLAHHQSFSSMPFNFINFRGGNPQTIEEVAEKTSNKKEHFDNATIQSIKNELFSNNNVLNMNNKTNENENNLNNNNNSSATTAMISSYEDEDYNNDNIDVETDSDNDQQISESKHLNYHNVSDAPLRSEEWSKIMKNTMMLKSNHIEQLIVASANDSQSSLSPFSSSNQNQHDKLNNTSNEIKIDSDTDTRLLNVKRVFVTADDEENEYFNEPFTDHNLLNLSDSKKRGKYGNTKGFSIENLIGRMVEDR